MKKESKNKIFKYTTLGLITMAIVTGLVGCTPSSTSSTSESTQQPFPTYSVENLLTNQNVVPPDITFLSFATRYSPENLAAIVDPNKRDIFSLLITANAKNTTTEILYDPKTTVVVLDCSDSRICIPPTYSNVSTDVKYMDLTTTDVISGKTVTISRIGAQPVLGPVDLNQYFFIPHQTAECITGGCGALGGVEALVNSEDGVQQLIHHGVSQMTIDDIRTLIKMGAGSTPNEATTIEQAWAQTGARMTAEINHKQYVDLNPYAPDRTYYSGFGVFGTTDDSFQAIGVVDNTGKFYSIDDFPALKAFAGFINKPHPALESLLTQAPDIIAINGSRIHDTNKLFGELSQKPGILFKSSVNMTPGVPMSVEEAKQVIAGADYSVGALTNSKFITLVADNAADMAVLRTTLMTEGVKNGSMRAFFEQGGIVVEMIPDAKTGRFTGLANILTAEDLSADLTKLNILTGSRIASTVNIENSFLGQLEKNALRDLEIGVINEAQFSKIQRTLSSLRPFSPFFKYGLQMLGDYFTIKDIATWIDQDVMGHSLIWENPSDSNHVIWNVNNPIIYTADQNRIRLENQGANPYLISGRLDKIYVFRNEMIQAYDGAIKAYIASGPGMANSAEPWNKMASANEVGKLLTLKIIPPYGPADGEPLSLTTTLVIKPADENFDNVDVTFNDADPNQQMMLVDQLTGLPIFSDIPGQKTTVIAIDPANPNIRYLFEVSSVPNNGGFEFNFVGIVPAEKEQSDIQEVPDTLTYIQQIIKEGPMIPVGNLGIPLGPYDIFSYKTEDDYKDIF